jgi:hypothetical protein
MSVREILKMGDPRLLRQAQPVERFGTPDLDELIRDMFDTMHAANGAGLAAPQIGVDLQVVIFGFSRNVRYPDAPPVPETVRMKRWKRAGKAACRCPACAAWCRVTRACITKALISTVSASAVMQKDFTHAWYSMNVIT